jgi:hypothetical protein
MGVARAKVGVVVLGLAALVLAESSAAAGAATQRAPTAPSRSAHVAYQGCAAKDVELTVTLSARTYGLGQNVRYMVRLHNRSATRCPGEEAPAVSVLPGPSGPGSLEFGRCGSLPMSIRNTHGAQVFPDTGAIACPMMIGQALAPHATLRFSGTWDRVEGGLRPTRIPRPAPPGRYRLVIDGVVSLPFTLTNAPPVAALTARTTHGGPKGSFTLGA